MMQIRHAADRGHANFGWLDSRHTFSFGSYYDAAHMGVSVLRVINDDRVEPGQGFDPHSHRDMEIISYVLEGSIEHRDSTGATGRLGAGEVQLMRAGRGITHSEYNPSADTPLHFLQIWILPDSKGLAPGYAQRDFRHVRGIRPVVDAEGRDGALRIAQDVTLYLARLRDEASELTLAPGRVAYVHVARGQLRVNGELLAAGDGATLRDETLLRLEASGEVEALVFDLP